MKVQTARNIAMTIPSFRNCWKFTYVCTNYDNIVYEHRRVDDKWLSEKRDRYGNRLGCSIRTDAEMEPIFNHMRYVSECEFYSPVGVR